jgi:hypothetical protein
MKTHVLSAQQPEAAPAYLSNGVIGLRVPQIPFLGGRASVNGFVDRDVVDFVESYTYAPYPLATDICLGTWWLSQRPNAACFEEQHYDFSNGELTSRFNVTLNSVTAHIEVLTFCCRSLPTLALQETRVSVNAACPVSIRVGVDPEGIRGDMTARDAATYNSREVVDGSMRWDGPARLAAVGSAFVSQCLHPDGKRQRGEWGYRNAIETEYSIAAQPGQSYVVRQITSLVPSVMHGEPDRQAIRMAWLGQARGFEGLREENRAAWAELWRGRVHLLGAESRWQEYVDAAFFYLHTSVHQSSPCSTGLFGLGFWHNYHHFRGHVFWDIETWSLPPLLLTAPHAARAILDCRSERLPAARLHAKMNGYRGVMFPWESSPLRGEEVTPGGWPQIIHEQHVSLDVAFAFAHYVHATGDEYFLREQAWPVLHGVAEWICSRVLKTERGYEIRQVIGIDEGAVGVPNNAYTNIGAIMVLREAILFARRLGFAPSHHWHEVERNMYLPIDSASNALEKYDDFQDKGGGTCPDSLACFFPFGYRAAPEVEQATCDYYLCRREGYIGYPMLSAPMGVWVARTGDRELSRDCFERGVADFVFGPFMEFDEFGAPFTQHREKVGPYLAHCGGFLMSCMYGLTGLVLNEGEPHDWGQNRIVMPQGWDGVQVERIYLREREAHLVARHGDERCTLEYS